MLLLSLLLTAASTVAPVHVAPHDPSAQFKGDGGAIKFDPACRNYDIVTVQTNPACAARVANGEAAPSLAVAVNTLSSFPARSKDAIKLLEHSATVADSPAVHYLLGTLLSTGEALQPNYPVAVRHLGIAAQRGNPAAADLLASLILSGKGAPRDVSKAIGLYETAAANGLPNAAVSLGKLYLGGKFVPKDEKRGLAWLDAASAANAPGAAQLAALAKSQDKITNFQLIPSADPAKVKAVRYGTFDNPDIPPNFGFDLTFQALHDAPYDDPAILARLEREAASMPTPYLYELARRLATKDADRSLQTFLVARTRMMYDASRCADSAALEGLRAWDALVLSELRFLLVAGRPSPAIVGNALAQEAKLPADTDPWWICRSGMAAMSAAINGTPGPLKLKPTSEWPVLRNAAQMDLRKLAGSP